MPKTDIKKKRLSRLALIVILVCVQVLFSSCYHDKTKEHDALVNYSEHKRDSVSFSSSHHYSQNYNFVVKADSLALLRQQPEELLNGMMTDTIVVKRHDHLVVADIRILPYDPVDSVWVQVARDQQTFGWVRESRLLPSVVPDDPISQFISTFSDTHLLVFLIVISIISVAYLMRTLLKAKAKIVHFNDIDSFYPTLLALIVAASATFYASIQMFAPEVWRHFYYHPTLNPFSVPPILAVFLVSVWSMLIIGLAVVDIMRHNLPTGQAVLYMSGLAGVCSINYIIFSILTLHYIGYLLFVAYAVWAIKRYYGRSHSIYICGNCGAGMHRKGRCKVCGVINE